MKVKYTCPSRHCEHKWVERVDEPNDSECPECGSWTDRYSRVDEPGERRERNRKRKFASLRTEYCYNAYRWMDKHGKPEPIASGAIDCGDGYKTRYNLFEDIRAAIVWAREHLDIHGYDCRHTYDCCGHWYPDSVMIESTGRYVIVSQNWAQNI